MPETEITFRLPGVRVEYIQAGERWVCSLTAVTPLSETETEVDHVIYWREARVAAARDEGRPFKNPVEARVLRWRS